MKKRLFQSLIALGITLAVLASGCAAPATPIAAPSSPTTEPADTPVTVAEAEITFEVPASFERQDGAWRWAKASAETAFLGFDWAELEPPMEVEAVLLPGNAVVLDAETVELDWGAARQFTVEVYAPAVEDAEAQAPVEAVETHVLVVVTEDGSRRGYDFYASAADAAELAALQPALEAMIRSVTLQ